jgi:hypothetical protein
MRVLTGPSTRTPKGVPQLRRAFPWSPVTSNVRFHLMWRNLLLTIAALPVVAFGQPTQLECESAGNTWDSGSAWKPYCAHGTEKTCASRGGAWQRRGMTHGLTCVVPSKDGGKQCSDKNDCEFLCVYEAEVPLRPLIPGKALGRCTATNAVEGCYVPVTDGNASMRICE